MVWEGNGEELQISTLVLEMIVAMKTDSVHKSKQYVARLSKSLDKNLNLWSAIYEHNELKSKALFQSIDTE